jgi:hypothetical protein
MTSCKYRFGDRHRLPAVASRPPAVAWKYRQEFREASFWRPNKSATLERVALNPSANER